MPRTFDDLDVRCGDGCGDGVRLWGRAGCVGASRSQNYWAPKPVQPGEHVWFSGEHSFAIGISEPGAGSAMTDMVTSATPDGDHVLLHGQKAYCTGGHLATHVFVFARWGKTHGVLRAHALLEGRAAIEEDDLIVLKHVLWSAPDQQSDVSRLCARIGNPINGKATELTDQAASVFDTTILAHQQGRDTQEKVAIVAEGIDKFKNIHATLAQLQEQAFAQGRPTDKIEKAISSVRVQITVMRTLPRRQSRAMRSHSRRIASPMPFPCSPGRTANMPK